MSDKKDKGIKYSKIDHEGQKALVFNYGGKKDGKLIIIALGGGCQDFDSGYPCISGNPDTGACPSGWTAKCVGGTTMCVCDVPI